MKTEQELENAIKVYRETIELEAEMERIENKIKKNHHRFNLNPDLKRHELPNFIIPKSSYDEIKKLFDFEYLK